MSTKNIIFSLAIMISSIAYLSVAYHNGLQNLNDRYAQRKNVLRKEMNLILEKTDSVKAGSVSYTDQKVQEDKSLILTTSNSN